MDNPDTAGAEPEVAIKAASKPARARKAKTPTTSEIDPAPARAGVEVHRGGFIIETF